MSRVLIFGGDGLLGSHLYLALRGEHELGVTLHGDASMYPPRLFSGARVFDHVAAGDQHRVSAVLKQCRPDWVINAVGLAKRPLAKDPHASLEANALFPHLLARLCLDAGARLLHFSTDAVFSGMRGNYSEADVPDATDWYGRCKLLGEPSAPHVLTLRTAFVGLELGCKQNLLEWFLVQQGAVPGFTGAIWSGFSAQEVGRVASRVVSADAAPGGVWHLAAPTLSKHEFLSALNARLGRQGVTVVPDDCLQCNRSLDGRGFEARTGYVPPTWVAMLDELVEDVLRRWTPGAPSFWPH